MCDIDNANIASKNDAYTNGSDSEVLVMIHNGDSTIHKTLNPPERVV